jgi:hypothetical protein
MLIHALSGTDLAEMVYASFKARPVALTLEIVEAVRTAVKAWSNLATRLEGIKR